MRCLPCCLTFWQCVGCVLRLRRPQVPGALEKLFAGNYDLLLDIFNPEGWLDISYVDDTHRVGRDDKGHVFYLERQ